MKTIFEDLANNWRGEVLGGFLVGGVLLLFFVLWGWFSGTKAGERAIERFEYNLRNIGLVGLWLWVFWESENIQRIGMYAFGAIILIMLGIIIEPIQQQKRKERLKQKRQEEKDQKEYEQLLKETGNKNESLPEQSKGS